MSVAIPPLPNTPSWRGAQLKNTGITLPLPLPLEEYKEVNIQHWKPVVLVNMVMNLRGIS
jgi:hypothetical protein